MARAYCIPWSEDDEVLGAREVGWSLHLSRKDAANYVKEHAARYDGYGQPYCVDVPDAVYDSVRASRNGLLWVTPCECPYPIVKEHADSAFVAASARQMAG